MRLGIGIGTVVLTAGLVVGSALASGSARAMPVGAAQTQTGTGTGRWCNPDPRTPLCMSASGKSGQAVVGRPLANTATETFVLQGASVCRHDGRPTDIVQSRGFSGDTTNCPMSAGLDNVYRGLQIETQRNVRSGLCNVANGKGQVIQGSCKSGLAAWWLNVMGPSSLRAFEQFSAFALERGATNVVLTGLGSGRPLELQFEPTVPGGVWVKH